MLYLKLAAMTERPLQMFNNITTETIIPKTE